MATVLTDKPTTNALPAVEALPDRIDNAGAPIEIGASAELADLIAPESTEVAEIREQQDQMEIDYGMGHDELDKGFRQKTYSRAKELNKKLQQEDQAAHADLDTNYVIDERGHGNGGGPLPEPLNDSTFESLDPGLVDDAYFVGAQNDAIGSAFVAYGNSQQFGVAIAEAYGIDDPLNISFVYDPEE